MAITITQTKKRQRYMLIILAAVVLATIALVWFGFLGKRQEPVSQPLSPEGIYAIPKVDIDWQMLEEIKEETSSPFKSISAFEDDFGRKNPFIPY